MNVEKQSDSITAMTRIVEALSPLSSEERGRVVAAALTLLGETGGSVLKRETSEPNLTEGLLKTGEGEYSSKANIWIKQHQVSQKAIEEVFHFEDGTAEIVASELPGKGNGEKVLNAYRLAGIANFLASGTPQFNDDLAREVCRKAGCYDTTNHSKYLKSMGNEFAGNKTKGWTLTAPGLKQAALLIKSIAGESGND